MFLLEIGGKSSGLNILMNNEEEAAEQLGTALMLENKMLQQETWSLQATNPFQSHHVPLKQETSPQFTNWPFQGQLTL